MLNWALKAVLGTKSQRDVKKLRPRVECINQMEAEFEALSDDALQQRSRALKERIQKDIDKHYEVYEVLKRECRYEVDRLKAAEDDLKKAKQKILDDVLEEAFAMAREAGKRVLNMRHYDVQLMGGIVLHQGKIAEMTTGEGKTLVATLPVYLNALTCRGVHVVTVNDYLAERDRHWMGPLYEFLGLTVGVILYDMNPQQRQEAYGCDITFGTNNEYGFDYLRDNMGVSKEDQVQRPMNYCIVDEVDSILIDEARTPLIISGSVETVSHCYDEVKSTVCDLVTKQNILLEGFYKELDKAIEGEDDSLDKWLYVIHRGAPKDPSFLNRISKHPKLKRKLESSLTYYGSKERAKERVALEEKLLYIYDEKSRDVSLSANGEEILSSDSDDQFQLDDITEVIAGIQADDSLSQEDKEIQENEVYQNYEHKGKRIRSFEQLLKAYVLFHLDVDYVVDDNKVVIVDEFTGRMMPGRRFSDGLHEALEAKENVQIQRESQTLATITFQNYFRMYHKLSGMTGTADTEAGEFHEIYKLDVVVIPTNRPMQRENNPDVIYKTSRERFNAVVDEIEQMHRQGRPVLVGTVSIERSEHIAQLLQHKKIIHEVLNAKNHAREAEIITMAGQGGAVTIATNMAGRGTDIVLGEGVSDKGGLHVIGTERHESRRIDNQLRGRAGRQGDPGSSRFFLSFEDDLMRIFGSDRIARLMERLNMEEGEDIQSPLVTRAIETAQKRVEAHNFDIRKWLLKYDNVMNKQREVIYAYRQVTLEQNDLLEHVFELAEEMTYALVCEQIQISDEQDDEFDGKVLAKELIDAFRLSIASEDLVKVYEQNKIESYVWDTLRQDFERKISSVDQEDLLRYMRYRLLESLDKYWKDHLYMMDELRESVGLRAYGQIDPLHEYQKEGHRLFTAMVDQMKAEAILDIMSMPIIHVTDTSLEELKQEAMDLVYPDFQMPVQLSEPAMEHQDGGTSLSYDDYQMPQIDQDTKNTYVRKNEKVGRNAPCPCGSGKKYKKCCGH